MVKLTDASMPHNAESLFMVLDIQICLLMKYFNMNNSMHYEEEMGWLFKG